MMKGVTNVRERVSGGKDVAINVSEGRYLW